MMTSLIYFLKYNQCLSNTAISFLTNASFSVKFAQIFTLTNVMGNYLVGQTSSQKFIRPYSRCKLNRLKRPISYYNNSKATHRLLLIIAGVEQIPWLHLKNKSKEIRRTAPQYTVCEKPVAKNHKSFVCEVCQNFTHTFGSMLLSTQNRFPAPRRRHGPAKNVFSVLPFRSTNISEATIPDSDLLVTQDKRLSVSKLNLNNSVLCT